MSFGIEHTGVLDAFAFDARRNTVVLAMYETRPWTGGEKQMFELQEKLNAYASFLLDGEFNETYPDFANKRVEIQLRTRSVPHDKAQSFIAQVRDQLSLQDITFTVIQIGDPTE
jgi:hypothetical protein